MKIRGQKKIPFQTSGKQLGGSDIWHNPCTTRNVGTDVQQVVVEEVLTVGLISKASRTAFNMRSVQLKHGNKR